MRSRCLLHKKRLKEFAAWLARNGWRAEGTKGDYEVLRMRHANHKDPLLVYDRNDAKEHFTTHGVALQMSIKFHRDKSHVESGAGVGSGETKAAEETAD